jgi:hypothetical protein
MATALEQCERQAETRQCPWNQGCLGVCQQVSLIDSETKGESWALAEEKHETPNSRFSDDSVKTTVTIVDRCKEEAVPFWEK